MKARVISPLPLPPVCPAPRIRRLTVLVRQRRQRRSLLHAPAPVVAPAHVPAPVVAPAPAPAPVPVPVPAPRKKADISAEDLDAAGIPVDSDDESEESEESEESKEESEEEPEEKEEKEKELAVQGGIAHGKVDQVAVSCNCICIWFCIPVIVM
jgi:hypothetical protein